VLIRTLDRLVRSTRDPLNILDTIVKAGAGFRSLADTWPTRSHGRLMLIVLGGLAEFERELIRARTGEGRARAAWSATSCCRRASGRTSLNAPTASPCSWRR
jgi:DNA invertase Pin-like site-specific DNA recombinase